MQDMVLISQFCQAAKGDWLVMKDNADLSSRFVDCQGIQALLPGEGRPVTLVDGVGVEDKLVVCLHQRL